MSNVTHTIEVKEKGHQVVSTGPGLIITAQSVAGEAHTFQVSRYGKHNHVSGFRTGEDKIEVPLELLQAINSSTIIVKGVAQTLAADTEDDMWDASMTTNDALCYPPDGGGKLYYAAVGDQIAPVCLLTLDGRPALAASDIIIV